MYIAYRGLENIFSVDLLIFFYYNVHCTQVTKHFYQYFKYGTSINLPEIDLYYYVYVF